jgi:hypothetical protein
MCTDFRCIRLSLSGGITASAVLKLPINPYPANVGNRVS